MFEIYVPVKRGQGEWRAVDAVHVGGMRYRVIGTMPEDEEWAFTPGEEVECEMTELHGKTVLTAKRLTPLPF
ncbi:MAG: hypothetical protein VX793_01035 [Pseudomonadota bacterium]|nr:hypothetical protein [Pseudomonadota bacterium]